MKARILALAAKINGITTRERGLIMLSAIALVYGLFEVAFLKQYDAKMGKLRGDVTQVNAGMTSIESQINEISAQYEFDPDAAEKKIKQNVENEIVVLDAKFKEKMGGLITPSLMVALLQGVLTQQSGLTLTQLKSINPTPLLGADASDTDKSKGEKTAEKPADGVAPSHAGVALYRHGLMIDFDGDFMSTLAYLKKLETLPWELYWDVLDYEVTEYPRARVRIQVHTISADPKWIGV